MSSSLCIIYIVFFRTHLAPMLWCIFVHSSTLLLKRRCTLITWWKWNGNEQTKVKTKVILLQQTAVSPILFFYKDWLVNLTLIEQLEKCNFEIDYSLLIFVPVHSTCGEFCKPLCFMCSSFSISTWLQL